jgi:hypothetical protein
MTYGCMDLWYSDPFGSAMLLAGLFWWSWSLVVGESASFWRWRGVCDTSGISVCLREGGLDWSGALLLYSGLRYFYPMVNGRYHDDLSIARR